MTKYLGRKNKAFKKSRDSANQSTLANRRAKVSFFNTVNATMNNVNIPARKKFNILQKLMKNNKFSPTPPLLEGGNIVKEPKQKSDIFNEFFASKSYVDGFDDEPPNLERLENVKNLCMINTSPLEVGKLVRNLKKSHSSHCGISGKFLQLISTEISYSLFNNLF